MAQDLEEIRVEFIGLRKEYSYLVGTLYPNIVYRRLLHLRESYAAAGGELADLPSVIPPNCDGRAPAFSA